MRDIWYGDRRDRVKWGALVHLVRAQQLAKIVQVAYYRHLPDPELEGDEGTVAFPKEVWDHFSDLRNIQRLAEETGIEIVVLDQVFEPAERRQYIKEVILDLQNHNEPKIVFLDPDTGIQPKTARPEHVALVDIEEIFAVLVPGDWLAIYQHAYRRQGWLEDKAQQFTDACGVEHVKTYQGPQIAADVAVFAAQKSLT